MRNDSSSGSFSPLTRLPKTAKPAKSDQDAELWRAKATKASWRLHMPLPCPKICDDECRARLRLPRLRFGCGKVARGGSHQLGKPNGVVPSMFIDEEARLGAGVERFFLRLADDVPPGRRRLMNKRSSHIKPTNLPLRYRPYSPNIFLAATYPAPAVYFSRCSTMLTLVAMSCPCSFCDHAGRWPKRRHLVKSGPRCLKEEAAAAAETVAQEGAQ